ncbi:MAG: hypothetical protein GY859_02855 [Desulfobacterales bacterium]|nr:hypothetical protein [Desulfobacterales bacterium]
MAYRKTTTQLRGEISLNGEQLKLLMAIEENKSLGQIASETGFDNPTLKRTLASLLKFGLIERVQGGGSFLDRKFIDSLQLSLAQALGPMAEFLIEDAAADLGAPISRFPTARVAELIMALAREIPDADATDKFKKAIIPLIPK